jgi:hypothetical protein
MRVIVISALSLGEYENEIQSDEDTHAIGTPSTFSARYRCRVFSLNPGCETSSSEKPNPPRGPLSFIHGFLKSPSSFGLIN